MKVNAKVLALMTALAAGVAGADAAVDRTGNLTNAGTTITNTATASFTDPTSTTGGTLNTNSNTVSTTVAPRMGFDLTYNSGADSDTTDNVAGAQISQTGVVTGTTVVFPYTAVNNGNATQTINLTSDATSGVSNIKYYLSNPDTNGDGKVDGSDTPVPTVTSVTVAPSGDDPSTAAVENNTGMVPFWMSYTVDGAPGTVVGATPIGTAQVWDSATSSNVTATEQKDPSAPAYDDLYWQYSKVTLFTPVLDTVPQTGVTTNVDTPPTGGTNVPGYTSGTTPIEISGDEQIAYPKADSDTTNDQVVFTNTVTNSTALTDTVTLSIVPNSSSLPGSTLPSGYSQTVTPTGTPGVYTVVQTNPDGSTTTATVTLSTTTTTLNPNTSANYTVTVNYPDQDTANPYPIYVAVGVDSGLDNNTTPDAYTFDTVRPPAMDFGDTASGQGAAVDGSAGDLATQAGTPGSTVNFPMDVVNNGEYSDTYNLSGYTVVTLSDGTKQIVPVVYSGTGVTDSGTTKPVSVDLNGDGDTTDPGETVNIPVYTTGAVAPNNEAPVTASVTLPANTALSSTGYTVNQTATAVYSGISLTDTNDKITVAGTGNLLIAKFTQGTASGTEYAYNNGTQMTVGTTAPAAPTPYITNPSGYTALNTTSYAPGVQYSYEIVAKNTYNAQVQSFFVFDTLNTNLEYVGVSGTISGNVVSDPATDPSGTSIIYSADGTTWTSTAPAAGTTKVYVAVDDPTKAGLQPGALDQNAQLTAIITVKVK